MALESEPTIPIIISVCALMISILGYADNRKKMDILMRKENKKKVVEEAIEILRNINYTLKDLSHPFNFTNIDQMIVGIIQEVCGKDKIKLSIRYESLKLNDDVIFTNSLKDPTEFTNKIRNILFSFSREGKRNRYFQYIGSNIESSIDFTTQPNFICIKSLGLGNLFTNLVKLENDLSNLVRVEFLIEPFDPELFQLLNENYECI